MFRKNFLFDKFPLGTDDCEGGDGPEGLLGPRCQSRLFQPDDPLFSQDEPPHEALDQSRFHDMVRMHSPTGILTQS